MIQWLLLVLACQPADPADPTQTTDSGYTPSTHDTSSDTADSGSLDTSSTTDPCTIDLVGDTSESEVSFDFDDVVCWSSEADEDRLRLNFVNSSLVGEWVYMEATGDVGTAEPRVSPSLFFQSEDIFNYWANGAAFHRMTREDGTPYRAAAFRTQAGIYTLTGLPRGSPASIQVRAWICSEPPGSTETYVLYGTPGYGYADDPPLPCYE